MVRPSCPETSFSILVKAEFETGKTSDRNLTFKETPISNAVNRGCVAVKGERGLNRSSLSSDVSVGLLIWIQHSIGVYSECL